MLARPVVVQSVQQRTQQLTSAATVVSVDTLTAQNREKHITDKYHTKELLVLRRGFDFVLSLTLSKGTETFARLKYPSGRPSYRFDSCVWRLSGQKGQNYFDGRIHHVKLKDVGFSQTLCRRTLESSRKCITRNNDASHRSVSFRPSSINDTGCSIPANASVGQYILYVQSGGKSIKVEDPLTVLFNTWCEKDQVYLGDAAEREEYVLNDNGYTSPWS